MKQKILIVDDKPENLFTLEDFILENLDVEVFKAERGNDALKLFLHHQFSLAILDVQMPEMDGYELAKYIRIRNESRSTPIIFLSAVYSDDFHVFKGYDSGGVDFITKPFNPQLLLNKIRFFIRLKAEEIKRKQIENNLAELVRERTEELEKAKFQAEEANRAKSNFLATMSHEIRTPMHAVLGMADLLKSTKINKVQTEYIKTIHQAGELLLSIINDILDFSKIEAGKLEFEKTDFELLELVKGIINLYDGKASEKGIFLEYKTNIRKPIYVLADSVRIKQILNNLINNAIKFTDPNGKVILQFKVKELPNEKINVRFRVVDNGKGIDPQKKKILFQPFAQEDNTITRRYGGSGLGLSIIKNIIEKYNGSISVKSKLNEGSIFFVNLTLDKGDEKNCTQLSYLVSEKQKTNILANSKILVAEDGKFNQILIKEMFSKIKCSFTISENGEIALNEFKKNKYDIVLMDCQMPVMDGYEAATQIRKYEQDNNLTATPIIALTANAIKGNKRRCLSAGMNYFLSKPFKKQELIEKLTFCIQNTNISPEEKEQKENEKFYEYEPDKIELLFDINPLKILYNDVGDEIYNLLESFTDQAKESKKGIEIAVKNSDYSDLSKYCHALKGCSSYIGAINLTESCDILAHKLSDLTKDDIKLKAKETLSLIQKTINKIEEIINNKTLSQ